VYEPPHTVLTIFALYLAGAFHVIDTGHIGVYKRGGAMLNSWTEPGLHFMLPFITKVRNCQLSTIRCRSRCRPIKCAIFQYFCT
jgi:regulator of protease activity HflC (stomatin/prohibitin superfamily)